MNAPDDCADVLTKPALPSQDTTNLHSTLVKLIDRLDSTEVFETEVIPWSSPVLSFGNPSVSRVATLGLNPSNREFVDASGDELRGGLRRFHSLRSLGLDSWAEVDARHLNLILETCRSYFISNPYDRWFKRLDSVVEGTNASYYDQYHSACHLDLIPYATSCKWNELATKKRSKLLNVSSDILGLLLKDSAIRILILNGRTVVEHFQRISGVCLDEMEMPGWLLPRHSSRGVAGLAYKGTIDDFPGTVLGHQLLVLGFNHNLQSSFGLTRNVIDAIRSWIAQESRDLA